MGELQLVGKKNTSMRFCEQKKHKKLRVIPFKSWLTTITKQLLWDDLQGGAP
jgi:hypothetical protein